MNAKGTSKLASLGGYMGSILTTRRTLTRVFGQPAKFDKHNSDGKVNLEWTVSFPVLSDTPGTCLTARIYDYKRYDEGKGVPSQDELIQYNIGGCHREVVALVVQSLGL